MDAPAPIAGPVTVGTEPVHPPASPKRRRVPRLALLGPAVLGGGVLWACYFPLNFGWLAWIALVPLFCLVRSQASSRVYFYAWLCGLTFFFPALQWLRVADPRMYATWFALASYCSLYTPAAVFLVRRLERRAGIPLILAVPAVWTGLEFLRAHFMGGFAWYYLAHTQHAFLPVIQIADLAGAFGVTFVVALANAVIFEALASWEWFRTTMHLRPRAELAGPRSLRVQAALAILLVAGVGSYGLWRLRQDTGQPGPRVALIQGNLDQRIRNAAADDREDPAEMRRAQRRIEGHYQDLRKSAATQHPDLIVWPETSLPYPWEELGRDFPEEQLDTSLRAAKQRLGQHQPPWQEALLPWLNEGARQEARQARTNVLLGMNTLVFGAEKRQQRYNSAIMLDALGRTSGRYDKMHRVPFGEYVPLVEMLPWMNAFAPYDFDYSIRPGKRATRFTLGPYRFGVLICYEDTDPDLARGYARAEDGEPAVDFLLNISNDGWFDGTSEHDEHLAIARLRAVECRRSLARAVNMGISAVVDGNGRVVALPAATWAGSKKIATVLTVALPIDRRTSLYSRWGDWLPWGCVGLVVVGVARSFLRRHPT